jgi:predicted transcriptional regulator
MRTAVSIPDNLFDTAEKLAEQLGVSRSELYARAIEAYAKQRGSTDMPWAGLDETELTRMIDAAVAGQGEQSTRLKPDLKAARNRVLAREEW